MLKLKIFTVFVFLFALQACAAVTTYGKQPEVTGPDRFQFKLYYNLYANDGNIRTKADEIVEQLRVENTYSSCALLRNDTRPQSGINARASEIFDVVCKK